MTMTGHRPTRQPLPDEVAELVTNYPTSDQMKAAAAQLCAQAPGHADRVRLMHWIAKQMENGYLWADGVPS